MTEGGGLILTVVGWLEALSSHRMLDRLIRGRLWIGIVAFALIGIVTLQLGLLKLNNGIGHALEKQGALRRENAALSIENSELAGGSRVETQAQRLGMRLSSVGALKFRDSHARTDVPAAATALKQAVKSAEVHTETAPPAGSESAAEVSSGASESQAGGASAESAETAGPASGESGAASAAPTESAPAGETAETPAASAGTETSSEAGGGTAAPAG